MPPKKKLTRYDAAYDHLGPAGLGFPKRIIRTKIDSLLKVYGKDEGWIFIEECSYKLLIECLLEDQEILLLKGPEEEEDRGNPLLNEKEEEDEVTDQQLLRKNSTIIEKRITRSSSAARTSNAIDIFEPTGYEPRTEEVKKRIEDNKYLLPAAEKERSQRKLAGLVAFGNDGGKLVSAQEKWQERLTGPLQGAPQYCMRRPCFGLLDSEDDGEEEHVFSETKASIREQMAREGSVIPKEVQKSWWDVVGAT
ncbi:hypothetical protein MKX01_016489 [Papaver californicum]|nr:hypothetical protein MKX01_016489 [Papaver californicum]